MVEHKSALVCFQGIRLVVSILMQEANVVLGLFCL